MKIFAGLFALIFGLGLVGANAMPLVLHINANGFAQLGSGPQLNNQELRNQIHVLMREKRRPDIRVLPDRMAKADAIADVLRTFQQEGYGPHFGFTGYSQ